MNFEELDYYDSNYEEFNGFENTILANNTISIELSCRICFTIFSFNNQFHNDLQINSCQKRLNNANVFINNCISSNDIILLIRFKISLNQDIKIDYDFRDWQYCTTKISLCQNDDSVFCCLNTDAKIILSNETFFQKQSKNISIRIMIISITIRDFEINKHQTYKYAVIFMYFEIKNKSDIIVKAVIIREIHLIKDLKTDLLIDNDIFEFELIDIFTSISTIYIENYEITIFITINVKFRFQRLSIHALKTTIFSKIEYFFKIHNIILSKRNYFFESTSTANFFIYAHIV